MPQRSHQDGGQMKVVIVGGVAGGASCAARLRRLDEKAEIIMVERGPYVSYANCGLPYHISGVIAKESSLLVASEEIFRSQFAIDVRTAARRSPSRPKKKTVDLRNVATGEVDDRVVRQAGAVARRALGPSAAARHRPAGIFQVRTVPDARAIREWIERGTTFLAGHVQLLGDPVRQAGAACRGDRRRLHRSGDGGEPDPCRVRGDAGRDARSGPGPAGPGVRSPHRGAPEATRREPRARGRRRRVQAAGRRGA